MAKLTVAEASRRGYGTGLSILQAVQKEWLRAEKDAHGQLLVDAADLEALFGQPSAPVRAPASPPEEPAAGRFRFADAPFEDEADADDTDAENAAVSVSPDSDDEDEEYEPEPDEGWGSPSPPFRGSQPVADDTAALHAEIAELRSALETERRRTAALLDVLANRVLTAGDATPSTKTAPAADEIAEPANDEDADASVPADEAAAPPPAGAIAAAIATGIVTPDRIADEDEDEDETTPDAAVPERLDIAEADDAADDAANDDPPGIPDDGTSDATAEQADDRQDDRPDAADAEPMSLPPDIPPRPAFGGGRRELTLAADPQERRAPPAPTPAEPSGGAFVWQLWALVALVWIGLIGAFLWYVGDLGSDLWTIAQWLRGERSADTPQFAEALDNALRAARDIFGPPAALLVVLAVIRAAVRALRR